MHVSAPAIIPSGLVSNPNSRYKSFKMIGLHPVCALLFTAGYAMRAYGAHDHYMYTTTNLLIYILSQVFIYICPYVIPYP